METTVPQKANPRTDRSAPSRTETERDDAKLQARVLEATRRKPQDGSTHWSCRKLALELGLSKDTIHRVWRQAGIKPHRLERYMASDDPGFETKAPICLASICIRRNTQVIARGVFTSVKDLARKLMRYINAYSKTARPFQW